MSIEKTNQQVDHAIQKRKSLITAPYDTGFRLINGFLEGIDNIVVEVYAKTLVCHDYSKGVLAHENNLLNTLIDRLLQKLPWITTVIVKQKHSKKMTMKRGHIVYGSRPDKKIKETDIWYSLNLMMNQDSSFYLDTRYLRAWVHKHLKGKSVLNTFAYTGSIGIAALVGGASEVIQLDLNKRFLDIAKQSTLLNGKVIQKSQYQSGDFWSRVTQYKQSKRGFDCIILDPPVYAKTKKGTIDLAKNYDRLINKVRPLIHHNGYLITVNNALFQSGIDHYNQLNHLCKDGYLIIQEIIPVPEDCIGDASHIKDKLPQDPSPYNHATKITILRVKKKCANA